MRFTDAKVTIIDKVKKDIFLRNECNIIHFNLDNSIKTTIFVEYLNYQYLLIKIFIITKIVITTMNIDISTAAALLGNSEDIKYYCIVYANNNSISYEDYKTLVELMHETKEEIYDLGSKIYYDNSKDDALAIPLFIRAAEEGEIRAVNTLAEAYAYGFGIEKNADKCVEYLQRGIDAESPFCYFLASKLMEKGEILIKDLEKSFRFMKIAADKGFQNALLPLANKYFDGIGTQKNRQEGMRYLKNAAENGNEEAKKRLKELEMEYIGFTEDERRSLELLLKPDHLTFYANEAERKHLDKAKAGNTLAQCYLGLAYFAGDGAPKNYTKAIEWFRKAAEAGNGIGQHYLGEMYLYGQGVPVNYSEAAKWLLKASQNGIKSCCYELGYMYLNGKGVPKDYQKAFNNFLIASENGDNMATANLGSFYLHGYYVKKDYHKAFRLFNRAALAGEHQGYYMMGKIYENGYGVRRNKEKAAQLYTIAAKMGNVTAKSKASELAHYIKNPWIELAQEVQKEIIKDQIKDLLSDIITDAVDKMLDEDGSYISEAIGDAVADALVDSLLDD